MIITTIDEFHLKCVFFIAHFSKVFESQNIKSLLLSSYSIPEDNISQRQSFTKKVNLFRQNYFFLEDAVRRSVDFKDETTFFTLLGIKN